MSRRSRVAAILGLVLAGPGLAPPAAGQPLEAPVEALATASRRSPVVVVVEGASPSVVNISTEQKVENPFHPSVLDSFFKGLLEGGDTGQQGTGGDHYVASNLGSGVIIDPRGYVLTNEHVLWRASRVHVVLSDRRKFEAEVVGVDPRSDLAVLKVEPTVGLPAITLGTSSDLLIGETVIAIGNPYGLSNTVTTGVVSALRRSIKAGDRVYSDFIQTDASINPGNSGGALLTIDGELVGINTAILGEGQGIGFAIPVDRARKVFEDLVRYGEVRIAWLGLEVKNLDDRSYAALMGSRKDRTDGGAVSIAAPGVQVRRVYAGGPAEKAGLAAGDLVTAVGGEPVTSRTDYDTAISKFKAGDHIEIAYRKASSEKRTTVEAGEFPAALAESYLAEKVGIEVTEIPAGLRQRYPELLSEGVWVARVRSPSPASYYGLQRGDVLRGIYERPLKDLQSLRESVPRIVGRDAVLVKVLRGRYQYNVTIDLG
ncbi:MAG TPA: trypsin-like peptidase domain-containing protein [Candidatus Polarisedimenticolia bacterium]|nr:trypsin-like peptidase domain-containing protein [Candidatus Polarisedimenticolia bacterium]